MFKTILKSLGLALLLSISAYAQGFSYLPAQTPWRLAWDDANRADVPLSYELYYGTEKVATITPDDYKVEATVGAVRTLSASVPGVPLGTTLITLVAFDPTGQRSAPSLPLTGDGLGKPSAPQNLAKH